jgi:hypothetical protein
MPNQPDKQKELSLKADWKFITPEKIRYQKEEALYISATFFMDPSFSPQFVERSFFHPPCHGLM